MGPEFGGENTEAIKEEVQLQLKRLVEQYGLDAVKSSLAELDTPSEPVSETDQPATPETAEMNHELTRLAEIIGNQDLPFYAQIFLEPGSEEVFNHKPDTVGYNEIRNSVVQNDERMKEFFGGYNRRLKISDAMLGFSEMGTVPPGIEKRSPEYRNAIKLVSVDNMTGTEGETAVMFTYLGQKPDRFDRLPIESFIFIMPAAQAREVKTIFESNPGQATEMLLNTLDENLMKVAPPPENPGLITASIVFPEGSAPGDLNHYGNRKDQIQYGIISPEADNNTAT